MDLKSILKDLSYEVLKGQERDFSQVEIANVHYDSREDLSNSIFIAIKGFETDGHKYIKNAIQGGARVIVLEDESYLEALVDLLDNNEDIIVLKFRDTRIGNGLISSNFFSNPSKKLNILGVTGTNGKTSTTYFLDSIFEKLGYKTGVMGTIRNKINDKAFVSSVTTPESRDLQYFLSKMVEEKCEYVFMEVSSHALSLHRCVGLEFSLGIFTNLSQDHLDYHENMEDYFLEKLKLFSSIKKDGLAVINMDDPYGVRVYNSVDCQKITYGLRDTYDLYPKDIEMDIFGTKFTLVYQEKEYPVAVSLIGEFNLYNLLGTIGGALGLGLKLEEILSTLDVLKVPGRFEIIENNRGFSVVVDYAHTPDGLENVLRSGRSICQGNLISVFGCGGDRDNSKRPLMGRTSGEFSDYSIGTSDNPRTEDPVKILEMVEVGLLESQGKYEIIVNRKEAILAALKIAKAGDMVIISGKGHEDYQIIGKTKHHFSDQEIVREYLENEN